jgi:hypothetical protein
MSCQHDKGLLVGHVVILRVMMPLLLYLEEKGVIENRENY